MTTLPNFPLVSQLSTFTSDGLPNKDAPFECVAASIGAAILWYQGKSAWDAEISPDRLKDAVYGEAYYGGTSAIKYVPFVASLGYKLSAINGIPGQLVQDIHALLARNIPVIVTIPDTYVPASYGWTHVCVAFADSANSITIMDPYPYPNGVRRTYSDEEWASLLQFNQIWIVEKEEDMKILDLTTPEVSRYFELGNEAGNAWKCLQTGKIVQGGILAFYRKFGGDALCGLTYLGLPKSNEQPLPGGGTGAVRQYFERGVLCYDPPHKVDHPPEASDVYLLQLYDDGPGTDPAIAQLEAQIAALKAHSLQGDAAAHVAALENKIANAVKALQ